LIVGVDVTPLAGPRTGVARYVLELVTALMQEESSVDLRLLTNRRLVDPDIEAQLRAIPRLRAPLFPSRAAWMQVILPVALAAQHVDVCHYTNFDAPLLSRTPAVVTIHDMSLLMFPEQHPARRVLTLAPLMRAAARRARVIVCPSESARRDTIELLKLAPERVRVVAGAVAPGFRPITDQNVLSAARMRYGVGSDYLLFIGTIEPRKNLVRLAAAFARLRARGYGGQLVICGSWGWKSTDLRPAIDGLGIADAVVFAGFVPDEDLVALLNGAAAFVYPSLYEGFGLPIAEAMACGTPVVTADRGATAEVAGGAALLADPTDVESLVDALTRVLGDADERASMRSKGFVRAAQFDRANTARSAMAAFEAALGG
jgi:glycosyltransferase involved in cell wall biosynthesis